MNNSSLIRTCSSSLDQFTLSLGIPRPDFAPCVLQSNFQKEQNSKHLFPTIPKCSEIPFISPNTMYDILQGMYDELFRQLFILDVRYHYENAGGHIKNSINMNTYNSFQESFFSEPIEDAVIVIHCEFSTVRAPQYAKIFRCMDRDKHIWPSLSYPNLYILEGGYSHFYECYPECCDGGYTKMHDPTYIEEMKKCTTEYKTFIEYSNERHANLLKTSRPTILRRQSLSQSPIATKMLGSLRYPDENCGNS